MFIPGRYNHLNALRKADHGWYLGDLNEQVLLPNRYVPEGLEEGDRIRVFLYHDSEDRLIATNLQPYIIRDGFALLTALESGTKGAFFDWGLAKDLFVPHREQQNPVIAGNKYVVFLYLDEASSRLVGSTRIRRFLEPADELIQEGEEVELFLYEQTDLGWNAIVNDRYNGLLFNNRVFGSLNLGDRVKGYIRQIREDGKIDLSMSKEGYKRISEAASQLLDLLKKNHGHLNLHDKSAPEDIAKITGMSKKAFKMAVGTLYKERLIHLSEKGIHVLGED